MSTVDIKGAANWIGSIKLKAAAVRGLRSAALKGLQEIVTFIIPSRSPQPVDRGIYRSGWRIENLPDGAAILNSEPHAVFIEEGVKNVGKIGGAAIPALAEWAMRKGLASSDNALSVAAAIIRAMRRRGHIFGPQGMGIMKELREKKLKDIIEEEVEREVVKAIRRGAK